MFRRLSQTKQRLEAVRGGCQEACHLLLIDIRANSTVPLGPPPAPAYKGYIRNYIKYK